MTELNFEIIKYLWEKAQSNDHFCTMYTSVMQVKKTNYTLSSYDPISRIFYQGGNNITQELFRDYYERAEDEISDEINRNYNQFD